MLLVFVCGRPSALGAQHAQDHVPPPSAPISRTDDAPLTLFRLREASGTAWLPDETPMLGIMRRWRSWDVMLHGNVFAQVVVEPGDKHRTGGVENVQLSSANWGMAMARRRAGAGRVGIRAMLTAEPWTVAHCGFVNLLASAGEVCEGDTIHDRQHPHDVFMEVAMDYDRPVRGDLRWQVYAGLSGEPALGPAGFPHRLSALPNPIAPVTHHWLDASHITFGLVTTGLYQPRWKAEVSVFNGREPDARRANLDLAALDSVSARVSVMPTRRLALQISTGRLRDAEAEFPPQPRSSLTRSTASATYHRILSSGVWATTLAYGVNAGPEVIAGRRFGLTTHAGLLESALTLGERQPWFGRAELVGKPAHDLHAHEFGPAVFTVAKLEAGYIRHLGRWHQLIPGVGGMVSANVVPDALAPRYAGRIAPGVAIFLNVRPARHAM